MLNAISWRCGAEAPAKTEQVDCLQEIRLALAVPSEKKVRAGAKLNFLQTEVAVLIETEIEYPHI